MTLDLRWKEVSTLFYDYVGKPKRYAPVRFQEWSPQGHPRFYYALNPDRNGPALEGQELEDHLALIRSMRIGN